MTDTFFVTGCGRSATTAVTKVLQTAADTDVYVEQPPRLRRESRDHYRGTLANPSETLKERKQPAIAESHNRGRKYGDKNQTYVPFLGLLPSLWDCKIVLLVRDGRDVVRSHINYHNEIRGNIYVRSEDGVSGGPEEPDADVWDYSRLRPRPGNPHHEHWKNLSRFEKCAWMWSAVNELALDHLADLPESRYLVVETTDLSVDDMREIFRFLDLKGFSADTVESLLERRINATGRSEGPSDGVPHWTDWSAGRTRVFQDLAGATMDRLGLW